MLFDLKFYSITLMNENKLISDSYFLNYNVLRFMTENNYLKFLWYFCI